MKNIANEGPVIKNLTSSSQESEMYFLDPNDTSHISTLGTYNLDTELKLKNKDSN